MKSYFESLERRVRILEAFILEGKKDLDDLKAHLGDDLFDAYMSIRNRIPSDADLSKQFPDFTEDEVFDDETLFAKKYNNIRKHNLITGIGAKLFTKRYYPERAFAGDVLNEPELYVECYNDMKNYIVQTFNNFRSFEILKHADLRDVRDFVSSYTSVNSTKQQMKVEGAELIYNKNGWKVYRITTYKAAQLYGSGTRWCITGRYEEHEERGEEYFYEYIESHNLDGGYYFYINGDKKYCLLKRKDGGIDSIWNAADDELEPNEILIDEPNFPSVPNVFTPTLNEINLFTDSKKVLLFALELGYDVNAKCKDKTKEYYGRTPLEVAIKCNRWEIASMLLDSGAIQTGKEDWHNIMLYSSSTTLLGKLIRKGFSVDKNEMLEFAYWYAGTQFIETMLKLGANPDMKLNNGDTPLATEINKGFGARVGVVKALLKYGANANTTTRAGNDLLELAELKQCNSSIIGALRYARA